MKDKGLKCNIEKSFFGRTKMEYLDFWVTRDGVKPIDKNTRNRKYASTYFPKISMTMYRCIKVLPRYVVKTFTYISASN